MIDMGDINSQYWGLHTTKHFGIKLKHKHRVRRDGFDSKGRPWYQVESKLADDINARWIGGISGTAEWLALSAQSIEWADKNQKHSK
jgi:hypothetical protein